MHFKYNIGWLKVKGQKNIYCTTLISKKAVILISDKVDLRAKKIFRDRETLHNCKKISPSGKDNYCKCVLIKQQRLKIHEAK